MLKTSLSEEEKLYVMVTPPSDIHADENTRVYEMKFSRRQQRSFLSRLNQRHSVVRVYLNAPSTRPRGRVSSSFTTLNQPPSLQGRSFICSPSISCFTSSGRLKPFINSANHSAAAGDPRHQGQKQTTQGDGNINSSNQH